MVPGPGQVVVPVEHRYFGEHSAEELADGTIGSSAIVPINAFLFPAEVERVLSPEGVLVWVNSSGEQTPIYLSVDDLVAGLPGEWTGTSSRVGEGHWCVLRRA